MPDVQMYTDEAAKAKATVIKTNLALSKLRLIIAGLAITRFVTKAQLVAAECTFDGYTSGGYTLTAWTGPTAPGSGGALITSPLVNPAYGPAEDPPVTNQVGGWWVEDATGAVRLVGTYDPPRPMAVVGDGFPVILQILEALNPGTVIIPA